MDNDGLDGVWDYYALALATDEYYLRTKFFLSYDVWRSPCGFDRTLFETGPNRFAGTITYSWPFYEPAICTGRSNLEYRQYLEQYKGNVVAFHDVYCNDKGLNLSAPWTVKRAMAVTLRGQLVNRFREGSAISLHFFTDPPED